MSSNGGRLRFRSNSMACLYAIAQDCARRKVLGADLTIEVAAYDEMNIAIPVERIAARVKKPGHDGIVCLVGVQTNQYPRSWPSLAISDPGA